MKQRSTIRLKGPMAGGFIKFLTEKSPAERSGVAQPCPPSANGCPSARASGQPGADSSVRCPEVNGPALARIEKLCAAFIDINDGETAKDTDDLLDAAWLVIRQIYEIAVVEQVKPDAGQCNGQRVLPDNRLVS